MTHLAPDQSVSAAPSAEACRYCGVIDVPLLSTGTGPHACRASCQHCGRHLRWVSLLAPAERQARRVKARMQAMAKMLPTTQQLAYPKALGDTQELPASMAEASRRIDGLIQKRQGQSVADREGTR